MPDLDAEASTRDFQELLKAASCNQLELPTIIIAWAMPSHVGEVHPRNTLLNTYMSDSWIEDQYIALNGIRTDLHRQDVEAGNPERHVRWWELFWSYCHEVAHMFVTYLTMTHKRSTRCGTSVDCRTVYANREGGEAGEVFDDLSFGGRFILTDDASHRHPRCQAGIPCLSNQGGEYGIPLERVLNIANKTTDYTDTDFKLEPYKPFKPMPEERDPYVLYSSWFQDFFGKFGRPYAPLQVYHHDLHFPAKLSDITTTEPAQRHILHYPSIASHVLQGCCTRLVYYNDGTRIYLLTAKVVKILMERSDMSRSRSVASKYKPLVLEHINRPKLQQGSAITSIGPSRRDAEKRSNQSQSKSHTESHQGSPTNRINRIHSRKSPDSSQRRLTSRSREAQSRNLNDDSQRGLVTRHPQIQISSETPSPQRNLTIRSRQTKSISPADNSDKKPANRPRQAQYRSNISIPQGKLTSQSHHLPPRNNVDTPQVRSTNRLHKTQPRDDMNSPPGKPKDLFRQAQTRSEVDDPQRNPNRRSYQSTEGSLKHSKSAKRPV